jgi:DNA ligase 1
MTLLADVVAASAAVAATSSRSAKVATLAELLRALEPEEVPICVGFLSGVPRQGRVGIGYAAIRGAQGAPVQTAALTVAEVDQAISDIEAEAGSGSATRRRELLEALLSRAT